MLYRVEDFKGMVPRRGERLLQPGFAVEAVNCKLLSGEIRAFDGPAQVATPSKGAGVKTIYLYEEAYWLNWTMDVDVALSPVFGDTLNRFYWTGDGSYPKKASESLGAPSTSVDLPADSYKMGVPVPGTKPDVTLSGSGSGVAETRVYVYTYVTGWGEEGGPSPPSDDIDVQSGETVTVDNFEAAPAAEYNVTHRRIYRTLTGADSTTYQFVAEIAIATSSYADSKTGKQLGEVIPTVDFEEPPDDLTGLVAMGQGNFAGFTGRDIYFSEPFQPHAWPSKYALTAEYDVVALGVIGNMLVVTTTGDAYLVYGDHPSEFSMEVVAPSQPCLSKRGLVSAPHGVVYPAPSGLFFVSPGNTQLITKDYFTRDEWQALKPENLIADIHDGRYYGFFGGENDADRRGIVFDPSEADMAVVYLDKLVTAVWADPVTNYLYVVIDDEIQRWDADADNPLHYKWRAKLVTSRPTNFGAAAVTSDLGAALTASEVQDYLDEKAAIAASNEAIIDGGGQYESMGNHELNILPLAGSQWQDLPAIPDDTLQFNLYASGVLVDEKIVSSDDAFRLSSGYRSREFEVEVEGAPAVKRIELAHTMREIGTR